MCPSTEMQTLVTAQFTHWELIAAGISRMKFRLCWDPQICIRLSDPRELVRRDWRLRKRRHRWLRWVDDPQVLDASSRLSILTSSHLCHDFIRALMLVELFVVVLIPGNRFLGVIELVDPNKLLGVAAKEDSKERRLS